MPLPQSAGQQQPRGPAAQIHYAFSAQKLFSSSQTLLSGAFVTALFPFPREFWVMWWAPRARTQVPLSEDVVPQLLAVLLGDSLQLPVSPGTPQLPKSRPILVTPTKECDLLSASPRGLSSTGVPCGWQRPSAGLRCSWASLPTHPASSPALL